MNRSYPTLVILLGTIFYCNISIFAQSYPVVKYNPSNGLVHHQVMTLFQDTQDYIWVGTKGGVSRYDGQQFVNFGAGEDQLLEGNVRDIEEDGNGNVWFLTSQGLCRYNGLEIDCFPSTNILLGDQMEIDSANQILIISKDQKNLYHFDGNNYQTIDLSDQLTSVNLFELHYDPNHHHLFIANRGSGVYRLVDYQRLVPFYEFSNPVFNLNKDINGHVYCTQRVAEKVSVYKLGSSSPELYKSFNDTSIGHVSIGPDGKVFYRKKNEIFFIKNKDNTIVNYGVDFNRINQFLWDRKGTMWVATEEGLMHFPSDAFVNFEPDKDGIIEYVWSMVEDKDGKIWMTSFNNGMMTYDGQEFKKIENLGIDKKYYRSFYYGAIKGENDHLYFPTNYGVVTYDYHSFSYLKGSGDHAVLDLYEDTDRNLLFVGTKQGIRVIFEDGRVEVLDEKDGLITDRYIVHIEKNQEGNYWLASYDGLHLLDWETQKISTYNLENKKLPVRGVVYSYADKLGNMWFGTTSGLLFKKKEASNFQFVGEQLKKNYIGFITPIDDHKILLGLDKEIATLDLDLFYGKGEVSLSNYSFRNGFTGYNADQNAFLKDAEGNIWIAASNLVARLDPKKMKPNVLAPSIHFKEIAVANEEEEENWETIPKSGYESEAPLVIPFKNNTLKFRFHSVALTQSSPMQYQFQLEGMDSKWSPPTIENQNVFTNLRPGNYVFRIKPYVPDSPKEQKEISFAFKIENTIWHSPFIWLLIAGIIGLGFYGWYSRGKMKIRNIFLQKEKVALVAENEKNKLLQLQYENEGLKMKALQGQMNYHFLSNVLNSIQFFIYNDERAKAAHSLKDLSKLMRLFLEATSRDLFTLKEEIEFVRLYTEFEKLRFEEQFEYEFDVDENLNLENKIPPMLLQPFVENAINHGLLGKETIGFLLFKATQEKDGIIRFVIQDNGIGRVAAKKMLDQSSKKGHQSRGTEIMKQRFDSMGKVNNYLVNVTTQDLYDDADHAIGTKVIVDVKKENNNNMRSF